MKISFVILTWNRYKFLEKCLESLIGSITCPEKCEIVVMDNGSTDGTRDVLKRYTKRKRFRIIYRKKNYGLDAYKKLFAKAKGELIVIVDDDVLEFPKGLDTIFIDYMKTFTDYGLIALNVIQNEFTDGAKPGPDYYEDETKDGKTIEFGPTGGWCACFRKKDYWRIWFNFRSAKVDMKTSEDGLLANLFISKLNLKSGLIKNEICFHACGPYYAAQYDHLDREIEKYSNSGLHNYVDNYKKYYRAAEVITEI